jgi:hypothetical protein
MPNKTGQKNGCFQIQKRRKGIELVERYRVLREIVRTDVELGHDVQIGLNKVDLHNRKTKLLRHVDDGMVE